MTFQTVKRPYRNMISSKRQTFEVQYVMATKLHDADDSTARAVGSCKKKKRSRENKLMGTVDDSIEDASSLSHTYLSHTPHARVPLPCVFG